MIDDFSMVVMFPVVVVVVGTRERSIIARLGFRFDFGLSGFGKANLTTLLRVFLLE